MPKPTMWQSIYRQLNDSIAEGACEVGERLPTESALAQRFGVNRQMYWALFRLNAIIKNTGLSTR